MACLLLGIIKWWEFLVFCFRAQGGRKQLGRKQQPTARKDRKEGGREGRKEVLREGRKEERKKEKKERRKEGTALSFAAALETLAGTVLSAKP